jgi:hypothetical protein
MADAETVERVRKAGVPEKQALAELRVQPFLRHGMIANGLAGTIIKDQHIKCSAGDAADVIEALADQVAAGDLKPITNTLLSQGMMLDTTATEMMRRAWDNVGEYPEAFQRYMNLAMKAQTQSRAALEALARIHQPREQVVRHVHVYEGGQAVVAEQLHMHGPGAQNAGKADQSHGQGAPVAALPSADPLGHGLPIPSRTRKKALQDARRDEPRRTARKQQRAEARAADEGDAATQGVDG